MLGDTMSWIISLKEKMMCIIKGGVKVMSMLKITCVGKIIVTLEVTGGGRHRQTFVEGGSVDGVRVW